MGGRANTARALTLRTAALLAANGCWRLTVVRWLVTAGTAPAPLGASPPSDAPPPPPRARRGLRISVAWQYEAA